MMKKTLIFSSLLFVTCVFAQSYRVTVETIVANRSEDKFSFTLQQGETQFKGFDGKLMAKRYRANGYPHKGLLEAERIEREEKKEAKEAVLKPAERVKMMLATARKTFETSESRLSTLQSKVEADESKVKELEALDELASRGSSSFAPAYAEYLKKNSLTAEDLKIKKMMRKAPKAMGDAEEIDMGSFCKMTLRKVSDKKLLVDMDYSFSRIHSYFYSDGNNNANTITKHPIAERFEKLGVKGLVLTVGKPYCLQFTRQQIKSGSLSEAVSSAGIFGGGDAEKSDQSTENLEDTSLDASGLYSAIKRKYQSDGSKVARVVITVRLDN